MKNSSKIISLLLSICLIISISSCAVIIEPAHDVHHDNGKHKGWYKKKQAKHPKHYEKHEGHGKHKGSKGKGKK
jgi:hypothetical protein